MGIGEDSEGRVKKNGVGISWRRIHCLDGLRDIGQGRMTTGGRKRLGRC
jgi:hypothetical protein